ncbi:unnamed protein product, partial [Discosporangium mesarthrocarpum]
MIDKAPYGKRHTNGLTPANSNGAGRLHGVNPTGYNTRESSGVGVTPGLAPWQQSDTLSGQGPGEVQGRGLPPTQQLRQSHHQTTQQPKPNSVQQTPDVTLAGADVGALGPAQGQVGAHQPYRQGPGQPSNTGSNPHGRMIGTGTWRAADHTQQWMTGGHGQGQ